VVTAPPRGWLTAALTVTQPVHERDDDNFVRVPSVGVSKFQVVLHSVGLPVLSEGSRWK
jgi:hypothetical protein